MPIAKYPRPGKRIAPHSLAQILSESLPGAFSEAGRHLRLKDLDGSAWATLGDSACQRAARAVVAAVTRRIRAVGTLRIATLPDWLEWNDLYVGVRAYNALTRRRKLARPASLTGWPLAELMKINAFGVKSLVDLLAALEDATELHSILEAGRQDADLAKDGTEPTNPQNNSGVAVDGILGRLPAFLERRVGGIPERLEWADLDIRVRTYNALAVYRRMGRPGALNGLSIGDLMRSHNFGRKSLHDLLTALESATGCSCLASGDAAPERSVRERDTQGGHGLPLNPEANKEEKRRSLDLAVALMKLEQVLGPDVVHVRDPRFGSQVRTVAASCSDTTELLATLPAKLGRAGKGHEARVKALQNLCAGIKAARGLGLLPELRAIVSSTCTDTHARIILRFWGWDGRGEATLQQVGDEHGLSRERVRQITKHAKEQLALRGRIFAPTASRALEIAQGMLPATASTVAEALMGEGLVPMHSDVRFLGDVGPFLGYPTAFRFDRQYGSFVSTQTGERMMGEVHRQASRLASKYGAACVEDVCDALRADFASTVSSEGISRFLRTRSDLHWLDDEHLWFSRQETGENILLNRVHRVVAVAGRVRISELRAGVARDYALKGAVPPRGILLRLCGGDPMLKVEGEVVAGREAVVLDEALSPAERVLWRVLLDNGSVMERSQLERGCLAGGISRPSFQHSLTYSPVVVRYASQVYGLRGVAIPPGAVEAIQPLRGTRKGRLLLDSGWVGDGRVRLIYRLSEGCVSNGIVSIPTSFTRFLQGDFELLRLGNPVGTLRCRGAQAWGLGPLFRRVCVEVGDILTVDFDLQRSKAHASLTAEVSEESMAEDPTIEAEIASAAADTRSPLIVIERGPLPQRATRAEEPRR